VHAEVNISVSNQLKCLHFGQVLDMANVHRKRFFSVKEVQQLLQMSAVFSRKPTISLKRGKIGPRLLLMTNRKSHTCFRLVPKWTTLRDLEQPLRTLVAAIFELFHNAGGWDTFTKFGRIIKGCYRKQLIWPKLAPEVNSRWWWAPFWILFYAHNSAAVAYIRIKFATETESGTLETKVP